MSSFKRERMDRAAGGPETKAERIVRLQSGAMRTGGASGGRGRRRLDRGLKITLLSFALIAGGVAVMKHLRPELAIGTPMAMFAAVFGGCMLLTFVARRRR